MLIKQAQIEAEEFKRKTELEVELKRRATELQANLKALKIQGAAEAAITEAEILEAAYEEEVGKPTQQNVTKLAPYHSHQCTSEYTVCNILRSMGSNSLNSWNHNPSFHQSTSQTWTMVIQIIVESKHARPLKFYQDERCPLQTHVTQSKGKTYLTPSRAPLHDQSDTTDLD